MRRWLDDRWGDRHPVLFLLMIGLLLLAFLFPATASAQDPIPDLPDDADVTAGMAIYQSRCATCHGPLGLGDGELATQAINRPPPIGDPNYLATADLDLMFATIQNGNTAAGMPGFGEGNNSNPLSEGDIWDVLAAVYALPSMNAPIDVGMVTGGVRNFTTGNTITSGTAVLQAFDPAFNEALALEATIGDDGRYRFDLQNTPPQYLYRVVVTYEGLEFSSDFGQLSVLEPTIELAVDVFDQSRDPAILRMSQVDTIVEFLTEAIRVSQVYVVDNTAQAIFVGESGNFENGTLTVAVPADAENVTFLRGIGNGATDFLPLDDLMIQQSRTDWSVALPIASGATVFRLVTQYELPYEGGVTFSHPLYYPVISPSLILQDASVDVVDENWSELSGDAQPTQFVRYQRPAVSTGGMLQVALQGSPRTFIDEQGNMIAFRDEQQELVIGAVVLAVVVAIAVYSVYQWRVLPPAENERDTLLLTLAALDEAYANDKMSKSSYQRERKRIKERLLSIWPS